MRILVAQVVTDYLSGLGKRDQGRVESSAKNKEALIENIFCVFVYMLAVCQGTEYIYSVFNLNNQEKKWADFEKHCNGITNLTFSCMIYFLIAL